DGGELHLPMALLHVADEGRSVRTTMRTTGHHREGALVIVHQGEPFCHCGPFVRSCPPGGCRIVLSPCAASIPSEVQSVLHGRVHHPRDRGGEAGTFLTALAFHQGDVHTELTVALHEFRRPVQGVHQPVLPPSPTFSGRG